MYWFHITICQLYTVFISLCMYYIVSTHHYINCILSTYHYVSKNTVLSSITHNFISNFKNKVLVLIKVDFY